jgi:hypothetical protein
MEMIKSVYPIIRYIAAVCVVTGMVACTSSPGGETDPELNEYPIAFQSPQMESRGAVDDAQDMSDFRVWGWRTPENESLVPVFEGEKVSAGSWTYEGGTRYWMMDQTYNFYAVHPVFPLEGNETTVNVISDGTFTIKNFDCSKTGDEAVDLMTASAEGIIYKTGETPQKVGLEFKHELCKVEVIVKTDQGVTITLHDAYFYGMAVNGTLRQRSGNFLWTFDENVTGQTNTPYKKVTEVELKPVSQLSLFDEMLLIPQECTEVKLVVSFTRSKERFTETIDFNQFIPEWSAGQNYRFVVTIEADAITFGSFTVDEWGETNTGGNINIGNILNHLKNIHLNIL